MKKTTIVSISIDTEFLKTLKEMAGQYDISFSKFMENLLHGGHELLKIHEAKKQDNQNPGDTI